jgi:hypothetical protein
MSLVSLVVSTLLIGYFWYLLIWPVHIIDRKEPAEMITQVVNRGEDAIFTIEYCKYKDYPYDIKYSLWDGNVYGLNSVAPKLPLGCGTHNITINIPSNVKPGRYRIVTDVTYTVNVLRTVKYSFSTEYFTVK